MRHGFGTDSDMARFDVALISADRYGTRDCLNAHNVDLKPFLQSKSARIILAKERRALEQLEAIGSGYRALD